MKGFTSDLVANDFAARLIKLCQEHDSWDAVTSTEFWDVASADYTTRREWALEAARINKSGDTEAFTAFVAKGVTESDRSVTRGETGMLICGLRSLIEQGLVMETEWINSMLYTPTEQLVAKALDWSLAKAATQPS